jgi:hypothetical protein
VEAQGMFQNILLAEYHVTLRGTPQQGDPLFFLLTFKTSLIEEEVMSTIYVFT